MIMKKLTMITVFLMALFGMTNAGAAGVVKVDVYRGHSTTGGGTPYSDLEGSLTSPDIQYGNNTSFDWHPFGLPNFGAEMTGVIHVPTKGTYTFELYSDDGSMLYIDGVLVVDNGGPHPPIAVSDSAFLTAGTHAFKVEFFEDFGGASGVDLNLPEGVIYGYAGTPGNANCHGKSVSELARQYGGIAAAASALGFPRVAALQHNIRVFCTGE
jgi:hypothetical protein